MTAYNKILFSRMVPLFIILFAITSLGFTTHRHICYAMEDNPCDMSCTEHTANADESTPPGSGLAFTGPLCHIDTFVGGTAVNEALTGKDYKSANQYVINSLFTIRNVSVSIPNPSNFIHPGLITQILIIPSVELFLLYEAYLL